MLIKEKLLNEIFKKTNYVENFLYCKFEDPIIENKFIKTIYDKDIHKNICFGIISVLFQMFSLYSFCYSTNFNFKECYIGFSIIIILSIIFYTISLKVNSSSRLGYYCFLITYCIQLLYFYLICIVISLKMFSNTELVFAFFLTLSYLLMSNHMFNSKYYSKFITLLTFIGYVTISIFSYIHLKKLEITIDNKLEICINFYCSNINDMGIPSLQSMIIDDNNINSNINLIENQDININVNSTLNNSNTNNTNNTNNPNNTNNKINIISEFKNNNTRKEILKILLKWTNTTKIEDNYELLNCSFKFLVVNNFLLKDLKDRENLMTINFCNSRFSKLVILNQFLL